MGTTLQLVCLLTILKGIDSQVFQAVPPTQSPTDCKDRLPNCFAFGQDSCQPPYDSWAKDYCKLTCGYCSNGQTVTDPPCVDKKSDCDMYPASVCTDQQYAGWARENCRFYCRDQLCTAEQRNHITTTTIAPELCIDKLDNCEQYGQSACSGSYLKWAKDNCRSYCKFCISAPTSPPPCRDKLDNCDQYEQSSCTDPQFKAWAKDNCYKHCGYCSGGALPPVPTATPAPPLPGK